MAPSKSKSSASRSSKPSSAAAKAAALDPNELRAEQAQAEAQARAEAYDSDHKSGEVHGHAVYDHDARQIAQVFNNGDAKQQKTDAAGYMGRLLGKTGEAAERDLSVVKLVEV